MLNFFLLTFPLQILYDYPARYFDRGEESMSEDGTIRASRFQL
jgi:hypothetical protein